MFLPNAGTVIRELIKHRAWKDVGCELFSTARLKYGLNTVPFTVAVREPVIGYLIAEEHLTVAEVRDMLTPRCHRRWEPDEDAFLLRQNKFTAQQAMLLRRAYRESIARRHELRNCQSTVGGQHN